MTVADDNAFPHYLSVSCDYDLAPFKFCYVKFNAEFNELFFWKFDFFQQILYKSYYLDNIV